MFYNNRKINGFIKLFLFSTIIIKRVFLLYISIQRLNAHCASHVNLSPLYKTIIFISFPCYFMSKFIINNYKNTRIKLRKKKI